MNTRPGASPFLVALPVELGFHGFRHAPAVGEAELREHRTRRGEAEILDQVLPEQAHRDGVEQERALAGEPDDAAFRIQLQQLVMVQVLGAHPLAPSN
jgi:hypothetical protein